MNTPRPVVIGRTSGGVAVGIGPGVRLIHFGESSMASALEQLLHRGRLTLPNAPR